MTENDDHHQPKFGSLPDDSRKLLQLFMSIESKYERSQIMQMVEAYVRMLQQSGLEDKPLKSED